MNTNNWHIQELHIEDENMLHSRLENEYQYYNAVKSGNLEYILEDCKKQKFADLNGKGTLSKDPLTNIKYHFVVTTAMVTRYCVMGGMAKELAYRLSDYYIGMLDSCKSFKSVCELHDTMVIDFTKRMHEISKKDIISKPITQSLDFIYENINKKLSVDEIAEAVNLSVNYFSRLFKEEMHVSASEYIRLKKIERAKNLLQYSDYSFIQISNYLSFASQSHFTNTFVKYVGITPKKFRDQYYRNVWETNHPTT